MGLALRVFCDATVFNKHVQVFETEKWAELVAAVNKCVADKVSVVVPMKLKVLQNKAQGVQGGYDADVVFVFNSLPAAWNDALHEDFKKALADSDEFKGFPGIPTTKLNYDPDLASLLSQVASYNMIQALPAIKSMLGGTP